MNEQHDMVLQVAPQQRTDSTRTPDHNPQILLSSGRGFLWLEMVFSGVKALPLRPIVDSFSFQRLWRLILRLSAIPKLDE